MKKMFIMLVIIFIISCFLPTSIYAGIGVTPSEINIDYIKPGTSIIRSLIISSSSNDSYKSFSIETKQEQDDSPYKISVNPNVVNFDLGQNRESVDIIVDISSSAQDKLYEDSITIQPILSDEYAAGVTIIPAINVPIQINITNDNIEELLVRSVEFNEYTKGSSLSINTVVQNKGNIDSKISKANLNIQSLQGNNLESYETFESEIIKAGEQKDVSIEWKDSENLPTGEYYANINLYNDEDVLFSDKLYLRHEPFKTEISESDNSVNKKVNNEIIKVNNKKKIIMLVIVGAGIVISLFIHKTYSNKDL